MLKISNSISKLKTKAEKKNGDRERERKSTFGVGVFGWLRVIKQKFYHLKPFIIISNSHLVFSYITHSDLMLHMDFILPPN